MDGKLVESYYEYIGGQVIDEDKIVTYKSLSRNLNIHVNTAKQLLYTFLTNEKSKNTFPISATYLIAGKEIDGNFNISVVNESDLKKAHANLVQVTSEHVYSVQNGKNVKEIKCLCRVDKESTPKSTTLVIKYSKNPLKQKEEVKKKPQFDEVESKKIIKQALATTKEIETSKKVETATVKTETTHKKISPKGTSEKSQTGAKKSAGNIANLFAKANQKNAEKAAVKDKLKEVLMVKKDEDKKNEKKTSKKRTKSKERNVKGSKRRRIQILSDSEESNDDDDDDDDEERIEIDQEEEKPQLAILNLEEEVEEPQNTNYKNKRKKRKVIDKTVMNEDGYLETKKEVVFETDSENETEEVVKPKEEKKPKIGKGKGVQNTKKQSSLLSFFKKD